MATAALDWSQCPAVESIPGKRSGAWVFRDTRTPVSVVFDNLEVGASINEIMDWFHLSHEQVVAVIEFAARSLDAPPACSSQPTASMLILFDNGTPAPLRYALKGHVVVEAIERGWDRLVNGELIAEAETAGFELLLTTDKNMRYQQNLTGPKNRLRGDRQSAVANLATLR